MPNYVASNNPVAIYPGDSVLAFSAESPTAPQASQQFALAPSFLSGSQAQLAIQIDFASAPTAVVTVQSAVIDADAEYKTTGSSSTNTQHDVLQVSTSSPFVRVQLTSQSAGGAITVKIYRMA